MVEPVFISVFDRFCGPIVSLKSYGQYNNQTLQPEGKLKECDSVWDVSQFLEEQSKEGLLTPSSTAYSTYFRKKSLQKKFGKQTVQSNTPIEHTFQKLSVKKLIVIIMQAKTVLVIHMSSL